MSSSGRARRIEAIRTATGLHLAALDGDASVVDMLLDGMDEVALRDTCRELAVIWADAITYFCHRAVLRAAVSADALDQAVMDDGQDGEKPH